MAVGKNDTFKLYNNQFNGAVVETLTQVSDAFNERSRGAIRLTNQFSRGNFEYESFFTSTSGLITRRDLTSVADVESIAVTQGEFVSVKVNRKIGPIEQTLDSFRKVGMAADDEALSFLIGTQIAKAMQVEMVNTAIGAVVNALLAQSDVYYTVPSNGQISTAALVEGLALMGDRSDQIVCWLMHSRSYYDLVQGQIAANIDGVSSFNVASASPVTLNRPVIMIDSPDLDANSPTDYFALGLTVGAFEIENSELPAIYSELRLGGEQVTVRLQGEYAYNLSMKGMAWDTQNGGVNPTDNAIRTGSNWDPVVASYKDYPGVIIQSR